MRIERSNEQTGARIEKVGATAVGGADGGGGGGTTGHTGVFGHDRRGPAVEAIGERNDLRDTRGLPARAITQLADLEEPHLAVAGVDGKLGEFSLPPPDWLTVALEFLVTAGALEEALEGGVRGVFNVLEDTDRDVGQIARLRGATLVGVLPLILTL